MSQHSCILSLFQIQDKCTDMTLLRKSNNLGLIPEPTGWKEKMAPSYMCSGMCVHMPVCMFIYVLWRVCAYAYMHVHTSK